jgi:hypothetical protein
MKGVFIIVACLLPNVAVRLHPADEITQQCSSIRELVYTGWYNQFADIIGDQLSTSSGHSEAPLWRFTNTKYYTELKWPGATNNFISDYNEETDSVYLYNRQFIAEMGNLPDLLAAQRLLHQLNRQIEGCPYLHNDSLRSEFRPLPHDSLPVSCPADLQQANLYELPLEDSTGKAMHQRSIMTGIEKYKQVYRVSLIVEDKRVKKKF